MLRHIDGAPALKYNDDRLESWLAGHLEKGSVHWRQARYVNVHESAQWEEVYSVGVCTLKKAFDY